MLRSQQEFEVGSTVIINHGPDSRHRFVRFVELSATGGKLYRLDNGKLCTAKELLAVLSDN